MRPIKPPTNTTVGFFNFLKYTAKLLCFNKPSPHTLLKPNTLVALATLTFFLLFAQRLYLLDYPLGMPKESEFYLALGYVAFISYRAYNGHSQRLDTGVVLLLFSFSLMYVLNQQLLGGAAIMYIVFWQFLAMTACVINSLWVDADEAKKN